MFSLDESLIKTLMKAVPAFTSRNSHINNVEMNVSVYFDRFMFLVLKIS